MGFINRTWFCSAKHSFALTQSPTKTNEEKFLISSWKSFCFMQMWWCFVNCEKRTNNLRWISYLNTDFAIRWAQFEQSTLWKISYLCSMSYHMSLIPGVHVVCKLLHVSLKALSCWLGCLIKVNEIFICRCVVLSLFHLSSRNNHGNIQIHSLVRRKHSCPFGWTMLLFIHDQAEDFQCGAFLSWVGITLQIIYSFPSYFLCKTFKPLISEIVFCIDQP